MNLVSIKDYVAAEKQRIKEKLKGFKNKFRLDIFQIGDNDASNRYIKWKMKDCEEVGIKAVLHKFSNEEIYGDSTFEDALNALARFEKKLQNELENAYYDGTDGIILQMPANDVAIRAFKNFMKPLVKHNLDIDGMFSNWHDPCTPRGIIDWMEYNGITLDGKKVTIIGRSEIVGKPLARMMIDRNATVTLCHSHTPIDELKKYCRLADVVVSAVGKPNLFKATEIAPLEGIIIDVGINIDSQGKMCGDILDNYDQEITMLEKWYYKTPVPGGVGLLTRLALIKNVIGE